jgi:hypothetical protein
MHTTIPHDGDLYHLAIVPSMTGAECGVPLDDLAFDVLDSLQPNPDTSFPA